MSVRKDYQAASTTTVILRPGQGDLRKHRAAAEGAAICTHLFDGSGEPGSRQPWPARARPGRGMVRMNGGPCLFPRAFLARLTGPADVRAQCRQDSPQRARGSESRRENTLMGSCFSLAGHGRFAARGGTVHPGLPWPSGSLALWGKFFLFAKPDSGSVPRQARIPERAFPGGHGDARFRRTVFTREKMCDCRRPRAREWLCPLAPSPGRPSPCARPPPPGRIRGWSNQGPSGGDARHGRSRRQRARPGCPLL